jgi:Flp pilus assembly protein TadG
MIKRQFNRCRKIVRGLVYDSKASVLPIFGIMVILMVLMAGAAMDISRVVNAREKLSYALDAAGLALAVELSTTVLDEDDIQEILSDSFKANLANAEFLDEAIENLEYEIDAENGVVSVTSSASLNNYFIGMGGYSIKDIGPDMFEFGTSAQVSYSQYDVELALVVDVTGSMSGEINDLKDASEAVVNILIPDDSDEGKVKISIIPYSVGVNLGSYASKATNNFSDRCATERQGTNRYTDVSYSTTPIGDGSGTYRSQDCSNSKILPLTDSRTQLLNSISALQTDGYTAGQTGIGWGWYTLSPYWSDLWPADSVGGSYADVTGKKLLKFALIMTDGDFNTHYQKKNLTYSECRNLQYYGEYNGTCKGYGTNTKYTYWLEKSQWGYNGQSSKRARGLCDAMKNSHIEIFTVYFGTASSSDGAKVMQACANSGNYYQASSSSDLVNAFANIAKKIQQIHLSK